MNINKLGGWRAQSLVEVLVALSAAALVLSGIAVVVISSLNNIQYSKNQNLASQYASQAMEVIRKIRDSSSSLNNFLEANGNVLEYCLPEGSIVPIPKTTNCGGSNIKNAFVRELKIFKGLPTPSSECGNNYKVTVTVSWRDGKCTNNDNAPESDKFCHKVNLVSCFIDRTNTLQKP